MPKNWRKSVAWLQDFGGALRWNGHVLRVVFSGEHAAQDRFHLSFVPGLRDALATHIRKQHGNEISQHNGGATEGPSGLGPALRTGIDCSRQHSLSSPSRSSIQMARFPIRVTGVVSSAGAVDASMLRDRLSRAVARCRGHTSPDQLKLCLKPTVWSER